MRVLLDSRIARSGEGRRSPKTLKNEPERQSMRDLKMVRRVVLGTILAASVTAALRAAVVFSGHPRSFLEANVRRNVLRMGIQPLCSGEARCELFILVSKNDASLFGNRTAARNTSAREVAETLDAEGWNRGGVRVRAVQDVDNPPPRARRSADCGGTRPSQGLGYELANVAMAFVMVTAAEAESGEYDAVVRARFDAIWVRPAPPLSQVLDATSITVPAHHFPINNHFAVAPRALADAYFEGPLELWARCDEVAGPWHRMLDNPEGVLLKSLLDRGIRVRRLEGLYLTIYRPTYPARPGGAECARLLAYAGERVADECACQFPSIDPVASKPPAEEAFSSSSFIYTFDDVYDADGQRARVALSPDNYRDALRETCARIGDAGEARRCLEHQGTLERAFEVLAQARAKRNILWDDSFISSAKFAELSIDSLEEWNAWARDPHQFFKMHIEELETELAADDNDDDVVDCDDILRCAPIDQTVAVDGADLALRLRPPVSTSVELFCAVADLEDEQCHHLHRHAQMLWATHNRSADCRPRESDRPPRHESPPSNLARPTGGPFDWLHDAAASPPPPPPPPLDESSVWSPPPEGLPAQLAADAVGYWLETGVNRDDVEAAEASDSDCILLQILDGVLRVRGSPAKLAAWDQSARPWRNRRRLAVVDLVASVAAAVGKDLEVVFCPTDCVVGSVPVAGTRFFHHHNATTRPLPALSLVACAGSRDVPFPVFDVRSSDLDERLSNWDDIVDDIIARRSPGPADSRAVFRGSTKGRSCWPRDRVGLGNQTVDDAGVPRCGRRRLRVAASRWPARFDVAYDAIPLLDQQRYRYHVYAEGHCGWSDRLKFLLFFQAGLFLQETFCREFFALRLQPWVHYLPLDYLFDNLLDLHVWAQAHPTALDRIIANMHAYAYAALSAAAVRSYATAVLADLADALRYLPPRDRAHMMSVADFRRRCDGPASTP